MGGRRSGGISDPEGAGDRTPSTRELASGTRLTAAAAGSVSSCKHFARQPPISGQAFCGQCGQGLTGLWQVTGKNRTTFEEMVQLDVEYAERKSLWLDLKIILKTLPALWQQCLDARALRRKQVVPSSSDMAKSVELYQL